MHDIVRLDEATHTYYAGPRVVPGVTRCLQAIDELDGVPRELLEAAARFGRHVHQAVHLFNREVLDEDSLDPALAPYLSAYKRFLLDTGAVVLASELMVYHRRVGFAGQLDLIAQWGRMTCGAVLDVKSGSLVPRSVAPQTAMYREAYLSERPGEKLSKTRYCLHLKAEGTYTLHAYDDPRDWNIALSCLNVWNWMNA